MSKNDKRIIYATLFIVLLLIEIFIGVFVRDAFVRPYLGDVLVIILLCSLIRIFSPERPERLGLYMIILGIAAELLQSAGLDEILGLDGTVFGIILGSTFDIKDIICYIIGGVIFFVFELFLNRSKQSGNE